MKRQRPDKPNENLGRRDAPEPAPPLEERGRPGPQAQKHEPGEEPPPVADRGLLPPEGGSGEGPREDECRKREDGEDRAAALVEVGPERRRQARRKAGRPDERPQDQD